MTRVDNLGIYLGIPSLHVLVTNNIFSSLLDKLSKNLEGWKMNYLSLAGRKVLAQSVLSTTPYYTMQSILLPIGVCNSIDKIVRRFLWGSTTHQRKCHLVQWNIVTKPKELGGLGLRSAKDMNMAFLAKLGWRFINSEKDALWVRILAAKYTQWKTIIEALSDKKGTSNVWKSIVKAAQIVRSGCRTQVRNGKNTRFWLDPWIDSKPLAEYLEVHDFSATRDKKVADFWKEVGGWNWAAITANLPNDIRGKINLFQLEIDANACDEKFWNLEPSGKFSVNSAYHMLSNSDNLTQDIPWSEIWRLKVPGKMTMCNPS